MKMYSDCLADNVKKVLDRNKILYSFDKELGCFNFELENVLFSVVVSKRQIIFRASFVCQDEERKEANDAKMCSSDMKRLDDKALLIALGLVARLNSDILCRPKQGSLSVNLFSAIIEYEATIKIIGRDFPSKEAVQEEIQKCIREAEGVFELYGPVFYELMTHKIDSGDYAFHKCRQLYKESERQRLKDADDLERECAKILGIFDDEIDTTDNK